MRFRLIEIETLPEAIAWPLMDALLRERSTFLVGALLCVMLGACGWLATGTSWYLVNTVCTILVAGWRYWQTVDYARRRESVPPQRWAWRALASYWATALCWAGWSAIAATEHDLRMFALILTLQAGLIAVAASRNHAVGAIAAGQVVIGAGSSAIACFCSGAAVTMFQGLISLLFIASALDLNRNLRQQALRALVSEHAAVEMAAQLVAANDELGLLNEHLEEQATTDPLTGLANRRAFEHAALQIWRAALREPKPVCALMIDVDHFKAYNDHYGHQAGDDCLKLIANRMVSAALRPGDALARYGGEEFVLLLPATDERGGREVALRVIEGLEAEKLPHARSPLGRVTVSIGMASVTPTPERSLLELIAGADKALYTAKNAGRNRAASWKPGHIGRDEAERPTPVHWLAESS